MDFFPTPVCECVFVVNSAATHAHSCLECQCFLRQVQAAAGLQELYITAEADYRGRLLLLLVGHIYPFYLEEENILSGKYSKALSALVLPASI